MPQEHEQWASWGEGRPADIIRLGINLGAPGDRVDSNGTLWLDEPSVGGPSPSVSISVSPLKARYHYRHSLWIKGGRGWPWVCASGVSGLSTITVKGLRRGEFTLRLYFAELEGKGAGERVFNVSAGGEQLLGSLDIVAEAGGPLRGIVKEFPGLAIDGKLDIELEASRGRALLCGLELISKHLEPGPTYSIERKKAGHRLVLPTER